MFMWKRDGCRTAASLLRASESTASIANSESGYVNNGQEWQLGSSELKLNEDIQSSQGQRTNNTDFQFPFGDWFANPWSKKEQKPDNEIKTDTRCDPLFCVCVCVCNFFQWSLIIFFLLTEGKTQMENASSKSSC